MKIVAVLLTTQYYDEIIIKTGDREDSANEFNVFHEVILSHPEGFQTVSDEGVMSTVVMCG